MMATIMKIVTMMVVIVVVMMSRPHTAQNVNAKKENVKHQYGKEMAGVMMVTTMQDVNGMEVIAVEMMLKPLTAKNANALIPLLAAALLLSPLDVNFQTGKVMVGVMMATTILGAPLMEVIVVEIM